MAQTENCFFLFFFSSILQWNDVELNSIHYSRTCCTLSSLLPPPTASYKAGVPSPVLPILKCLREQIQVSESSVLFKYLEEPTLIRIRNIQVNRLLQCYYSLPSVSIKKKKYTWLHSAVCKPIPTLQDLKSQPTELNLKWSCTLTEIIWFTIIRSSCTT